LLEAVHGSSFFERDSAGAAEPFLTDFVATAVLALPDVICIAVQTRDSVTGVARGAEIP
jgi:hypothetical protein